MCRSTEGETGRTGQCQGIYKTGGIGLNNLEEWKEAREIVKKAWKRWKPHFEILYSEGNEKLRAFFLLDDTDVEWNLYNGVPEDVKKDFSDYLLYAKEELLEEVGFKFEMDEEKVTESGAERATERLFMKCLKL